MNQASYPDERVSLRARFRRATREAILDAAAGLMGTSGAAQTRMEDIAARAGVAVGTVYNYFEDRTALVSALLETRCQVLADALEAGLEAPRAKRQGTATEQFEAALEHFVATVTAHFEANRFLIEVLLEDARSRGTDAKTASRRSAIRGDLLVRAERLMEQGIRSKALRKDAPAVYAAMLLGMIRGAVLAMLAKSDVAPEAWTTSIVRMFMRGAAR